ncbi:MAG TPA: MBL fold metallo-hydrolase [Polaromonas sp.]|uniref:MBL fold metallo-hydrolase n=1 Tax=Polaromonas sp. TaxID=1869339 RepID=UPI002D3C443E|nr:MBL fold metallo-hydrolase [Polaromonas sp.]HYW56408.1 MBL fold metallo-hydrolase [Polaromonas sp.]
MNRLSRRLLLFTCALALAACATSAGFQNLENPAVQPTQGAFKIWWRFLVAEKVGTVPVDPVPLRPLNRATLDALDVNANHVIRLGHSSHLLKLRGKYWLIDPVFSERASPVQWAGPKRFHPSPIALDELPPIEGLILSHDHYDHLDRATIEALALKVNRYFVPTGVGARLQTMLVPAARIQEFGWWDSGTHAGVQLTATPSQHFSGRTLTDRNSTLWASWVIQSGEERIFYSGDTGYFPGFKEIGERFPGIDLALMENGAYDPYWPAVHMTPEESIRAFQDLKAKTLYGVHNSTFDLAFHPWREPMDRLAALAAQNRIDLATPVIGEVLTLGKPRSNELWWSKLR